MTEIGWKKDAMAVLKAELRARSGAVGDDSLRAHLNAQAIRGLAAIAGQAGQLNNLHGPDLEALLTVIAENVERAQLSAELAALRRA